MMKRRKKINVNNYLNRNKINKNLQSVFKFKLLHFSNTFIDIFQFTYNLFTSDQVLISKYTNIPLLIC